ncbi:MAG: hypothetical protein Q9163_005433 [Psora crenata]
MADNDDIEGLRGLHEDLIALSKSQLRNVDRLWTELDARVDEFRRLLDKPKKNEASRKTLFSGTIEFHEDEYAINKEFQENAAQLADTLDLDEVESARLLLQARKDAELLDRPILTSAIIHFQQRRQYLLECLRMTIKTSADPNLDDDMRNISRDVVGLILETKDGPARSGSQYIQRCLQALCDIEGWLQGLGDRIQGTIALGQVLSPEGDEIIAFQQQSLAQQHESLSGVINLLVKASYSAVEDFHGLLEHLSKLERWTHLAVHYVPIVLAFIFQYGSPEGNGTLREARMLNKKILDGKENSSWKLQHLQAATQTWWLAEYSGWYQDTQTGSPVQGVNFEAEALDRSEAFFGALKEGAFQCALTICSQLTPYEWYDPARKSLITYLLRDATQLPQDMMQTSDWFRIMLMEQMELFVDAFITNMPDTLRRFKSEEEDQRKRIQSNMQAEVRGGASEQDLHLERFLAIISFAYNERVDAALSFWTDDDSNLYGFLQWASKRQSTPCVGAFCEMLISISKSEEGATSAHHFLLEDGGVGTGRIRRYGSLSWAQILGELGLYTSKIREQPQAGRPASMYGRKSSPDDIDEPESVLMLESYLRLISHLCRESSEARSWLLSQANPRVLDTVLHLCNGTVPSRLQACAFILIRALLTSKSQETAIQVWVALDGWTSGAYAPPNSARPPKVASIATWSEEVTFDSIASNFDQANEFTALLHALMSPTDSPGLNDQLTFPENLGSSYRMPGVDPFVDLVVKRIFTTMAPQLEEPLQNRVLTYNVLEFVFLCLSTFNEDLVLLASKPSLSVDQAMNTSSLVTYVRLHPFCRTMEWMFNDDVLSALFIAAHKDIDEISAAPPGSPVVLALIRSIEIMNLIMDLQSTFLNIARPLVKDQVTGRRQAVFNPSLALFEDSVALNLQLIVDLGLYSVLGNQELAASSLKLLGKLASSKTLSLQSAQISGPAGHGNRLIGVIDQEDDLDRISRSLSLAMQLNPRDIELGPTSPGWSIKSNILEFMVQTLSASPNKPTVAHAFLGFSCTGVLVDVDSKGLFAYGISLFHAILQLVAEYPDADGSSMRLWALSLRQMGMKVLSILWRSPLTSVFVLAELRSSDFLFRLSVRQVSINSNTAWDERSLEHPDFLSSESAEALQQYLSLRKLFYEYASTEIHVVAREGPPSLKARIFSALLGLISMSDGVQISSLSIFDLLDFVHIDIPNPLDDIEYICFADIDFTITAVVNAEPADITYDLRLIEEMLALRFNEIRRSGRLRDVNEDQRVVAEADQIIRYFRSANNARRLNLSRKIALSAWTDLTTHAIGFSESDADGIDALVLQALQILMPKLETYATNNDPGAIDIACLVRALVLHPNFSSSAKDNIRFTDVANDRLFQVFRAGLRAISGPEVSMPLREALYNICYGYLAYAQAMPDFVIHARRAIHTLKATGERMMDIICDDAFGASPPCRVSALLLLDALGTLAEIDKSSYITDSMVRTNFLQIVVESIECISMELRETNAQDIPQLLTSYEAKLSLILTVSQSKSGAIHVLNAGLFQVVRASGLFSLDPDIGVEIDNPEALAKYYRLLLGITRIIASALLVRGPQNDQAMESGRSFLAENRALVVNTFKRQAKIGGISFDGVGSSIEELVELLILLISMTNFLKSRGRKSSADGNLEKQSQPTHLLGNQDPQRTIFELFATSKQDVQDREIEALPGTSQRKRLKHSHISQEPENSHRQVKLLHPSDMYNFSANPREASSEVIDLTSSPDGSPPMREAPNDVFGADKITSSTGPRKLVVKNLKRPSGSGLEQYYREVWKRLDAALTAIIQEEKLPYSKEMLYSEVMILCRQDKAPSLYEKLYQKCTNDVSTRVKAPLIQLARTEPAVDVLNAVVEAWNTWSQQLEIIRSIFFFLDRSYLLHSGLPSIIEMSIEAYKAHIFSDPAVQSKVLRGACDLVQAERTAQPFSWNERLIHDAIKMFHTLHVYSQYFEPELLAESQRFYLSWAEQTVSSTDLGDYVEMCDKLIKKERLRCEAWALDHTTAKTLELYLELILIDGQEERLLNVEDVGQLLHRDQTSALHQLYLLLERRRLGKKLRPAFNDYIVKRGSEIVFDEEREQEMVIRLLEFKKKLDQIWEHSFEKNIDLWHTLREAFETFINKSNRSSMTWGTDNPKPGEMIAKYVDMVLKGGAKAIRASGLVTEEGAKNTEQDGEISSEDVDTEIGKQLDQVLDLFRFVHGKAVFEAFYKRDLARRLLLGRSASSDAEKSMLTRLKSECGASFTHNLEQMFKDIQMAREENSSYKDMLEGKNARHSFDLSVNVLSSSAWPSYPDITVNVPENILKVIADFERHYKAKHSGRKLEWKHGLAHCQLKAFFPKGDKEIVVSSFQAIVLLSFNHVSKPTSYTDLQAVTGLEDVELKRALQSLACAKYRILSKTPKGKNINTTDTFCINNSFYYPKYRIKINQIQAKESRQENQQTHERVAADRAFETQAAIVRIMKSWKKITHPELVSELITHTKSRGPLDPEDITKHIERLMDKDYMERDENAHNTYTYVA